MASKNENSFRSQPSFFSTVWAGAKSFALTTMNVKYLLLSSSDVKKQLQIAENPGGFSEAQVRYAQTVKNIYYHETYYSWAVSKGKDPEQHARYPPFMRFAEYVPVNTLIAWSIFAVPSIPMLNLSFATRSLLFNTINRGYCLTFDYLHRSPTPQELEDYGNNSLTKRLFTTYGDEHGKSLPLGLRFLGSIACAIGWNAAVLGAHSRWIEPATKSIESSTGSVSRFLWRSFTRAALPATIVCGQHAFDLAWSRTAELSSTGGGTLMHADGSLVLDEQGYKITSPTAGRLAVGYTLLQRSLSVIGTLTTASLISTAVAAAGKMPRNNVGAALFETSLIGLGLLWSVPVSVALVPRELHLSTGVIEPEVSEKISLDGVRVRDLGEVLVLREAT